MKRDDGDEAQPPRPANKVVIQEVPSVPEPEEEMKMVLCVNDELKMVGVGEDCFAEGTMYICS